MKIKNRLDARKRRHFRIRKKIVGTAERPRMSIMVSCKHMHVQFIDDERAVTMAAASTQGKGEKHNVATARGLGERAAASALSSGVSRVVVDRGGLKYHGRVRAIVEAAIESGLKVGVQETPQEIAEDGGAAAEPQDREES